MLGKCGNYSGKCAAYNYADGKIHYAAPRDESLKFLKKFPHDYTPKKSQSDEPSLYNPISPALYHVECENVNLLNRIIGKK